jgi:phytoene dehydrogenase-like protein
VRGGMGGISNALAAAAKQHGAEIRCDAAVGRILIRNNTAYGVALTDGTEIQAASVASNADANVTFMKLMDPGNLPAKFLEALRRIDYTSPSLKINVALSELPDFTALPGREPGPQHRGTIHISPNFDYIEKAYDDAKYGKPSESPILECTIPSTVDPTVAPPGKHLMSMFVQYAPTHLRDANWDDVKEKFADRCFEILSEYAPNFRQSVIARQVLTPLDIERQFALTGGNIFQGAMTLGNLFFLRPAPGYANYRTPIQRLYLCGSAAHPGGGVMGACGYNAAREILKER